MWNAVPMPKHGRKLHTAGEVKGEDAGMGIALLKILCYQNPAILDRKKMFSSPHPLLLRKRVIAISLALV